MRDVKLPDGWSVASCFEEATPTGQADMRYGVYFNQDGTQLHEAPYPYSRQSHADIIDIVWCVRTAEKWSDYPLPDTAEECEPEWYVDQMGRRFAVVWNHRAGSYSFISSHELENGGGLRGKVTPVRIKSKGHRAPAKDTPFNEAEARVDQYGDLVAFWKRRFGNHNNEKATQSKPSPVGGAEGAPLKDTPFNEVGTWIDHYGDFVVFHDGESFEYWEISSEEHGKRGEWFATGFHVDDDLSYLRKLRRYYYDAVEQPEALERHGRMREAWKRKFGGGE